jgi:hypothetical protein
MRLISQLITVTVVFCIGVMSSCMISGMFPFLKGSCMNECEQKHDAIPQPNLEAPQTQENVDPNTVPVDPATGMPVVQPQQQDPMTQQQPAQPMTQQNQAIPGQAPQPQMQQVAPTQVQMQQPMTQQQPAQPMTQQNQAIPGQAPQPQMQQVAPNAPLPPSPTQNNVKTTVTSKANKIKK